MAEQKKFLDKAGLQIVWDQAKAKFAEKSALNNKVDKEVEGTTGVSKVYNETNTSGLNFTHTDGSRAIISVSNGGSTGLMAQLAGEKKVNEQWDGSRINVYYNGIYYVSKANSSYAKNSPDMEIAVKKNISDLGKVLHFVGIAVKQSGEDEKQAVERTFPAAQQREGAVAICENKEFICYDTPRNWYEFGDTSQYALKSELNAETNRAKLAEANKADKLAILDSGAKSYISNNKGDEGATLKLESSTKHSAVAVNDGTIAAQVYAWKYNGSTYQKGTVIDVTEDKIYYYKGNYTSSVNRDIDRNEIATVGVVEDHEPGSLPKSDIEEICK